MAHQKGNEERLESGQEMLKQIFSKAKISPVGPSVRTKEDETRRNGDTLKYQKMKPKLKFTTNISIDSGHVSFIKWS